MEYAIPVWYSGLTCKQISEIESIQTLSFRIILGTANDNHEAACNYFGTPTLEQRRRNICLKFVNKNMKI